MSVPSCEADPGPARDEEVGTREREDAVVRGGMGSIHGSRVIPRTKGKVEPARRTWSCKAKSRQYLIITLEPKVTNSSSSSE